jgi:hypothetical protein
MKLETTVLGLKMQYYHYLNILDITGNVRIGSAGATVLRALTPAGLRDLSLLEYKGGLVTVTLFHQRTFIAQPLPGNPTMQIFPRTGDVNNVLIVPVLEYSKGYYTYISPTSFVLLLVAKVFTSCRRCRLFHHS